MSATGGAEVTSDNLSSSNEAPLQDGTLVGYFGDYELQHVLGEGGMGIVYKARQRSLNRPVALKMIKSARFPSADEIRRFQNESEAFAQLDHPNIVPIFEVGQFEDQHYFSMKLIAGESLDKRPRNYLANPRAAADLVAIVATAVHHAHQRGILHRDLKPANILIDAEGRPHVTDFGLAKRVEGDSELTRSGAILGTPAYMAPEQASGKRGAVTTATDVYGLGAVLYVLLTGKGPFGGDSVIDTLEQVRERQPEPPRKLNPRVPRDLEIICVKCLEKDTRRRYPSADALAEDLKRWLDGAPIAARPVGNAARFWMTCRRRPVIAGLTAAVLVAVIVGLVGTSVGLLVAVRAQAEEKKQGDLAKQHLKDALEAKAAAVLARRDAELESRRAKAQTELAEQRLYDVSMNLVQRYWEDRHSDLARLGLVELMPANQGGIDRRGFEWFYWQRKVSSLTTLKGHTNFIHSLVFSPDGKRLASASGDFSVKVWDIATGQEIRTLNGHTRAVLSVAFSPNGQRLASASLDRTVKVWDPTTGQESLTLKGHSSAVLSVAFSPDGQRLASASSDRTVKVWDPATGQESLTFKGHSSTVLSVAFSSDGKRLASFSSDGRLAIWDTASAQETATIQVHAKGAFRVMFSRDGKRIATATRDGTFELRDAGTGQVIRILKVGDGGVTSMALSPVGERIASGSWTGMLTVWDVATGHETLNLTAHTDPVMGFERTVNSVAFSPDGQRIASASWDGTVKVWDARPLDDESAKPGRSPR
jgi:Tol biopolymer transport system component/tRNA A-37 threonylcarbamoyl transferase component Bud32